ncbi:MAG: hypothetical protein O3C34_15205 [Proteobacteria bacterium]|nr:hypothetical protein [Pseudomonadota bacterium]
MRDSRNSAWKPLIFIIATGFSLVACQTTTGNDGATPTTTSSEVDYNLFWDQGDHLKDLVAAKKFGEAAKLYDKQKKFFQSDIEKFIKSLRAVADALNDEKEPKFAAAIKSLETVEWPAPEDRWKSVKENLENAKAVLAGYDSEPLLLDERFRLPQVNELERVLNSLRTKLEETAPSVFFRFILRSRQNPKILWRYDAKIV